jgi:Primase C terminal 2 (PriCT-2)/Protein of unknown function (DUF3987)
MSAEIARAEPVGPTWDAACLEHNWLIYKLAHRNENKSAKYPADPNSGRAPVSAYAAACLTLAEAREAAARFGGPYGIGYLPRPGSELVGIDLDNAIRPWDDQPDPWAADLLGLCPSWAERSPSGTGIRVIAARRGAPEIDTERKLNGTDHGLGYFGKGGRFFTVTFDLLPGRGTDLCSTPALVQEVLDRLNGKSVTSPRRGEVQIANGTDAPHWFDHLPQDRQDEEVERILSYLTAPKYGDYDEWLRISFAVYEATDSTGFEIWDKWCQTLPGYNAAENSAKWGAGFGGGSPQGGKATVGTLIYEASLNGYTAPADAFHVPKELAVKLSEILAAQVQAPKVQVKTAAAPDLAAPMFYGPLGEVVRKIDPLTEADPRGVMTCLLVMLGNWIGRRYYLAAGADRHFPAQQTLLVGKSALARKGTAGNLAKAAMEVFDPDWVKNNVFHAVNSGQGIAYTVKGLDERVKESGRSLGDKRALFRIDEFADALKKAQQKDNTILQTLRVAWDGGTLENTSISRNLRVSDATISVIGMITEAELRELIDPAQLATGSYNRINFCMVERSKVLRGHPPTITDAHLSGMRELREAVDGLQSKITFVTKGMSEPITLAPEGIPAPIKLSDAASEMAVELKARWETEGANWVEQANTRSYVHILRYALIYAVADASPKIEPAHLTAAEDLVRYFAEGIRQQATAELSDKIAERILTHMREAPDEALSRSDISCAVFQRNVGAKDLENAISQLEKLGLIRKYLVETKGRPRTMYALAGLAKIA